MLRPTKRNRSNSVQSRPEARRRAVRAAVGCALESLEGRQLFSTLTVNTVADDTAADNALSLREAIALIQNNGNATTALSRSLDTGESAQVDTSTDPFGTNDTIVFDASIAGQTINVASQIMVTKKMLIDGGASGMTLSGSNSRAFYLMAAGKLTLNHLTITNFSYHASNGGEGDGGAIYVSGAGATITLTNCTLSNNSAAGGDSASGNGGASKGGAIYATLSGAITLTNCTLSDNSATGGGGVNAGGYGYGGAIYADTASGAITLTNCTLSNNSAAGGSGGAAAAGGRAEGGAIYVRTSTGTITGCTLANNAVAGGSGASSGGLGQGGAVYYASGTLTITNSTLANNAAAGGSGTSGGVGQGGAIYSTYAQTNLISSTLSSNTAPQGGLGLYVLSGGFTVKIDNSILGQSDNSVADLVVSGAGTASGSNNLIRNTSVTGIGIVSSADPKLGPLQDNGGPTQTMLPAADSPALDAADDTLGGASSTDQRGIARPAGAYDIGAAELRLLTLTVSSTADTDSRDSDLTLREAVEVANGTLAYADLSTDEQACVAGTAGDACSIVFGSSIAGGTISLGSEITISETVVIDGGATGMTLSGTDSRAFYVSSTGNLTLNGLAITNFSEVGADGSGAPGGDADGGAVYVDHGALTITDSTLSNNSAAGGHGDNGDGGAGLGGAIYIDHGYVMITGTRLMNNSATGQSDNAGTYAGGNGWGGAIYNTGGTLTITDSTLSNNTATGGNGGTSGGSGGGYGGAVYADSGTLTLSGSTLDHDSAVGGFGATNGGGNALGGAVYVTASTLVVTNSTLASNSAVAGNAGGFVTPVQQGGAIYAQDGNTAINFSTLSANDAADGGRGLYVYSTVAATVAINNSILGQTDNIVTDVEFSGPVNASGSNNLIRNAVVPGVTSISSADPRLAAFGDYGGGVQTFAVLPDSPALDAAGAAGGLATDARGVNRTYNTTADIGAFESQGYTLTADASSTPQTAGAGQAFANDLTLTLTENGFGAAIPGATVAFDAPGSGASASTDPAATTASDGTASVPATANGTLGSYTVTASLGGPQDETVSFSLSNTAAPTIDSANHVTFTAGSAETFTITTGGFPLATLTKTGSLPTGVSLVDNGDGTATLSGTPTGLAGDYTFTITATNGVSPDATQTFTLTVDKAPTITSANSTTFTAGIAGSFTITTGGYPVGTLVNTGTLPTGVVFTDNGDGTATLSGTPSLISGGTYSLTFTASNGVGADAAQMFTLTVEQAPSFTSANSAAFTAGTAGTFTITAAEFPAGTLTKTGSLPSGVNFVDNGDGTATLAGTPALGTGGVYTFTIGADNGVGSIASQTFTLFVGQAPSITSADHVTFTVGVAGTFTVATAGFPAPMLSKTGTLPAGVTFHDNGDGTATLSGTPTGAAASYPLGITADNESLVLASQTFTLTVDPAPTSGVTGTAPTITSPAMVNLVTGQATTFTVITTGSPIATLQVTGTLPAGLTFVDNGDGTGTLSGTATTAGNYAVSIVADNGVGTGATQALTFAVIPSHPVVVATGHAGGTVQVNNPDGSTRYTIKNPFKKGVGSRLASADVNGDGVADIIMAAGAGGQPQILVYDGATGVKLAGFLAFAKSFTGGLFVAAADVDHDGTPDLVVGQGLGGTSKVRVFSGKDQSLLAEFNPIGAKNAAGVRVAAADLNGDGYAEIVAAQGSGDGRAVVKVLDGRALTKGNVKNVVTLSRAELGFAGGAYVATGDVNGDGTPDVVVSQSTGNRPAVATFNGKKLAAGKTSGGLISKFNVASDSGARIASYDFDQDGFDDIITSATSGTTAIVKIFSGADGSVLDTISSDQAGQVFVA